MSASDRTAPGASTPAASPEVRGADPARPRSPEHTARRFLFTALAIAVGATAGGLYAYYVGCKTGTCPITRSVPSSSLAGGVMGALIGWPGRRRQ